MWSVPLPLKASNVPFPVAHLRQDERGAVNQPVGRLSRFEILGP